jgi:acyl phosphate:glycerol-3-phosphate acyltransferase
VTETVLRLIIVAVAAYLIGGIPWALVIGKSFYGIDVRAVGSGNLGATNVYRVLGRNAGLATFGLDALKGASAVLLARLVVPASTYGDVPSAAWNLATWAEIVAAFAVILGHSYSPYIGFKGGKGVATAAGALCVLTPLVVPIELAVWFAVVWVTGMVSAGSVTIAALYPVLAYALYRDHPAIVLFALVGAGLVVWRHRANIARIARGEEATVSWARAGARRRPATGRERGPAADRTDDGRRV